MKTNDFDKMLDGMIETLILHDRYERAMFALSVFIDRMKKKYCGGPTDRQLTTQDLSLGERNHLTLLQNALNDAELEYATYDPVKKKKG